MHGLPNYPGEEPGANTIRWFETLPSHTRIETNTQQSDDHEPLGRFWYTYLAEAVFSLKETHRLSDLSARMSYGWCPLRSIAQTSSFKELALV